MIERNRRATQSKPKGDGAYLGPKNMASSPEAMLLAAVMRQAVDDFEYTESAVAHLKTRKHARRWMRLRGKAAYFIFDQLDSFLEWYGVEEIFHSKTIKRSAKRIFDGVAA